VTRRTRVRLSRAIALTNCVVALMACDGAPGSTGPQFSVTKACSPSDTVTLGPLQGTTFDCSNGGDGFNLAGGSGTYLIVPQFATGDVGYSFESYALGRYGAAITLAPVASAASPRGAFLSSPRISNYEQAAFDLRLLTLGRARVARMIQALSVPGAKRVPPPITAQGGGSPDSIRSFRVVADSSGTSFKTSVARLSYTGTYVYVYLDTTAPKAPNGFSASELQQFGQYADQLLYPLDLNTFGPPTDIDHNGHVIMLLTPIVNGLTPRSECESEGYVAGFFDALDLDDPSDPNSNDGEIFYQLVPDSSGQFSCAHSVSTIESVTPGTFLHELQHMINNGQHVLVHGGSAEEGWLDEGESIVATELGARYYSAKYPPPMERSNPQQLFPDSAEPFITEQLYDSYNWLTDPDTASVTLHTDADCCLAWRAGDWMLLRYVGDRFDSTVYARLDQSNITGTANLTHATGVPFAEMFANFGIALYTDSLDGVSRSAIPPDDRYVSYNFRQIYARLYSNCLGTSPPGCGDGIDSPFPIAPTTLTASGALSGSMVPGTVTFYLLTVSAGSGPVSIVFHPSSGSSFPASLHAQVAVFRTQ
jgi:hypothetical protein